MYTSAMYTITVAARSWALAGCGVSAYRKYTMPAFWLKWWGFWMTCSSAAAAGCWLWLLGRFLTGDLSPAPLLRAATARLLDIQALAAACAKRTGLGGSSTTGLFLGRWMVLFELMLVRTEKLLMRLIELTIAQVSHSSTVQIRCDWNCNFS